MNIHPFLVHFPIAFLSVYSLMELVGFRFITATAYWFYIKAAMVILGALGAVAAYLSGELAQKLIGESQIVEIHSRWAKASTILFGLIAAIYVLVWISRLEITGRIESYLKLNEVQTYTIIKKNNKLSGRQFYYGLASNGRTHQYCCYRSARRSYSIRTG